MKLALIINPAAGGMKKGKTWSEIKTAFSSKHITCDTFVSRHARHISELTSRLEINEYDALVSVGGDGTNFHMLNGLLSKHGFDELPVLGIIPAGSGNSFAMDLNIQDSHQGIQAVLNQRYKEIDVCSFTLDDKTYYFVNLAGIGFVTDVAGTAEKFKFFRDFSYLIGILYRTIRLKCHFMELEIDGKMIQGENLFVEFCNSRFTGGKMIMAPDARIDDGLMDIIVTGKISRSNLLATLPGIYKGTHLNNPAVSCYKGKTARIVTRPVKTLLPDGEIFGNTPSAIAVHHKKLRYFVN